MFRSLTLAGLCMLPLAAQSDETFYVGAGLTQNDYGINNFSLQPFDDEDAGFKLYAGWRPLENFSIEASYADHGNAVVPTGIVCIAWINAPCPATVNVDAQSFSAYAVGWLDLPVVDLFAKVGINAWQFDGNSPSFLSAFSIGEDGTGLAWGAGAEASFGRLGARLEYERLSIIGDEEIGVASLSVNWKF